MRRTLLAAAAVLLAASVGTAVVVADRSGDDDAPPSTGTAGPRSEEVDRAAPGGTTSTVGSTVVGSSGSAPVGGAILSVASESAATVDLGPELDCSPVARGLRPTSCTRVEGSSGVFVVYVGERSDGGVQARLLREEGDPGEFREVRHSPLFEPGVDVFAVTLAEAAVGPEPVVVVDYEFGGSGSVHSFDVVAWDGGDTEPRVVAFVGGSGADRYGVERDGVVFVSANYDDGAPTCCPNFADVRTLRRPAAGSWEIAVETVPFSEAP